LRRKEHLCLPCTFLQHFQQLWISFSSIWLMETCKPMSQWFMRSNDPQSHSFSPFFLTSISLE
jgi:hypothetical protein